MRWREVAVRLVPGALSIRRGDFAFAVGRLRMEVLALGRGLAVRAVLEVRRVDLALARMRLGRRAGTGRGFRALRRAVLLLTGLALCLDFIATKNAAEILRG